MTEISKPCRVSLKHDGLTGQPAGQTEWRATGREWRLARRPRRRAAWFYIAHFVTWSNQCALLHILHQWTDAGAANGYSHTI